MRKAIQVEAMRLLSSRQEEDKCFEKDYLECHEHQNLTIYPTAREASRSAHTEVLPTVLL